MQEQDEPKYLDTSMALEDDLVLTRIHRKAKNCTIGKERDQYMWITIYKLMATIRAYKAVLSDLNVTVHVGVDLFGDEDQDTSDIV